MSKWCHAKIDPLPKLVWGDQFWQCNPRQIGHMRQIWSPWCSQLAECSESELEAQSKSTCCTEACSIKIRYCSCRGLRVWTTEYECGLCWPDTDDKPLDPMLDHFPIHRPISRPSKTKWFDVCVYCHCRLTGSKAASDRMVRCSGTMTLASKLIKTYWTPINAAWYCRNVKSNLHYPDLLH